MFAINLATPGATCTLSGLGLKWWHYRQEGLGGARAEWPIYNWPKHPSLVHFEVGEVRVLVGCVLHSTVAGRRGHWLVILVAY